MSESSDRKKARENGGGIVDRFKQHPSVSIFLLCCAVAVGTAGVVEKLFVSPRDFEIDELKRKLADKNSQPENTAPISQIILEPTYLPKKSSIQTRDGSCFIRVDDIYHFADQLAVALSVTVGSATTPFNNIESGKRLTLTTPYATYHVDIVEIQEKQVSLAVTRQLIPTPAQK
jgi:hypothetical protein